MSALFVALRNGCRDNIAVLQQAKAMFAAQGFRDCWQKSYYHADILVYQKMGFSSDNFFIAENGNFAAYCGTFIFNGKTGAAALAHFLEEFRPDCLPRDLMQGHFCLVVCQGDELFLFGDSPGFGRLFTNQQRDIFCTSFMPLLSVLPRRTINPQALYEFVHTEAVFGGRTPVIEIDLLPPDSLVRIGNRVAVTKQPSALAPGERSGSFDDLVQETAWTLRRYFRSLARAFGNNFGCALSGGYDSRLILALLRDTGLVPRVHVYGPDHHPDVVIAKEIAAGEGLDFRHVNKSRFPCLTIDQFPAVVADNFLKFDGFPSDGIMDNGSDLQTRLERFEGGRLMLHGGCGEIYRNNTYLFDFDFTVRQFVDAFLTRGVDPRRCTRRFSARAYADEIGKAIKDLLPAPQDRLKRCEIEYLMACFWWRFWHGANINVENRFGYFMMPFGDYQLVRDALQIPIRYKYFGRFSAQLIKVIDHRLASYRSTYGHSPAHGPPPWRRAQELVNLLRPTWTRRYSYRVKNWTAPARPRLPYWLSEPYLATVLDLRFPIMSEFFVIERVKDIKSYNRICTLEMLFSRMNVGMP